MAEKLEIELDLKTTEAVMELKQTVSELDRLKDVAAEGNVAVSNTERAMRNLGTAASDAGDKSSKAAPDIQKVTDAAAGASKSLAATAQAAQSAGKNVAEGASKGKDQTEALNDSTKKTPGLLDSIGRNAISMITGFAGLHTVVSLMRELEQAAVNTANARIGLGAQNLEIQRNIQEVIDNFGLDPSRQGQKTALATLMRFQQGTGTSVDQAREILSMANSLIGVFDKDTQAIDEQKFAQALVVGNYASRTRLPAETAGDLFKMLATAGVEGGDVEGTKRLLAQFETAGQGTSLNSPGAFTTTALRGIGARVAQNVPMDQALAQVAAAAMGETRPERIATMVEVFSRVAAGNEPEKMGVLATAAVQRGLITPQALAAEREKIQAESANVDKSEEIAQLRESISVQEADRGRQEKRDAEDIAKAERDFRRGESAADRQIRLDRLREDAALKQEQMARSISKSKLRLRVISARTQKEIDEAAQLQAYRGLSLAQQEQLIYDMTEGLDETEIKRLVTSLASPEQASMVMRQLTPAARAKRAEVMAGVSDASISELDQRNAAFRTNTVSREARVKLEAERKVQEEGQGMEFLAMMQPLVDADIKVLQSKGMGEIGAFSDFKARFADRPMTAARTIEGLRAKRTLVQLKTKLRNFIENLTPEQYARHKTAIDNVWNLLDEEYRNAQVGEGMSDSGAELLRNATQMAVFVGKLIEEIQADAMRMNEVVPMGDELIPGGESPGEVAPGPQSSAAPAGEPFPSPNAPQPPSQAGMASASSPAGGNQYFYNITYGNAFIGAGGDLDLPGPLEGRLG